MMSSALFHRIALIATLLALVVIIFGAYVRLSDAGLGCPDWPGCYGQLLGLPEASQRESVASQHWEDASRYSHRLEEGKGWREMIHRYLASSLGLLILLMAVLAWVMRGHARLPVGLATFAVALVIFQGALGMWTVTLLLKPVVVMAHLLGGMLTLTLLWWLTLRTRPAVHSPLPPLDRKLTQLRPWIVFGIVLLFVQIALGGWTSANYAALACTGFPACNNQWWPEMDFAEAFIMWRGLGVDYEGGVLDHPARVATQMAHRIGALIVYIYLSWLTLRLIGMRTLGVLVGLYALAATLIFGMQAAMSSGDGELNTLYVAFAIYGALFVIAWLFTRHTHVLLQDVAFVQAILLLLQLILGVTNVTAGLPIESAVAHNGVAALLLLSLISALHLTSPRERENDSSE